jgi:hypothetical protein
MGTVSRNPLDSRRGPGPRTSGAVLLPEGWFRILRGECGAAAVKAINVGARAISFTALIRQKLGVAEYGGRGRGPWSFRWTSMILTPSCKKAFRRCC